MRHWLRLARVPLAPTAFLDAFACGWLALEMGDEALGPGYLCGWRVLWLFLGCTCLYVAGMVGNDWVDREVDRGKAPTRPLPSGAIRPQAALLLAVGSAAAGVLLLSEYAGSGFEAPAAAVGFILLYNGGLKRHLVLGALAMGGVRAANASVVAWPFVRGGALPAWVLLAPLCIGLYSAAIIVMSTTEDVDRPARQWAARVMAAIAFGGAACLAWIASGNPWPTLGSLIAFGVITSVLTGRRPRPGSPKRMVLEMLLALYFLEYVIASAAYGGDEIVALVGLALAFAMIWLSRSMIRALFVVRSPASDPAE